MHLQQSRVPAVFDYRQAEEIRDAFARHAVRYLFIGKSGAILLGYQRFSIGLGTRSSTLAAVTIKR